MQCGLEKAHLAHVLALDDVARVLEYAAHVLRVDRASIVRVAVVCLAQRRAADALEAEARQTRSHAIVRAGGAARRASSERVRRR